MILLDAYALVALVADEPAAAEVEDLMRDGDCAVGAENVAETVDTCLRVHGIEADDVRAALEPLFLGEIVAVLASGEGEAWRAAEIRAQYYDRNHRALSLADSFLLAHAVLRGASVATSDPPVAEVARAEGATVVPLPDSAGDRP